MTTITGIRIDATADETVSSVELDGTDVLRSLYGSIDCERIETIELSGGIDAIFDEEGKLTGAEPNDRASAVALVLGFRFLPGDYLAGPVIFLGFTDEGDHVSLTEEQRQAILRAVVIARG